MKLPVSYEFETSKRNWIVPTFDMPLQGDETQEEMIRAVAALLDDKPEGPIERRDLLQRGFTEREIDTYGDRAIARGRERYVRQRQRRGAVSRRPPALTERRSEQPGRAAWPSAAQLALLRNLRDKPADRHCALAADWQACRNAGWITARRALTVAGRALLASLDPEVAA